MKASEWYHVLFAVILFTIVFGFEAIINNDWFILSKTFFFAVLILITIVLVRKYFAYQLDSGVEHKLWKMQRFGFMVNRKLKSEAPVGILLPLFLSVFSLGLIKFCSFLTYETHTLKTRAAKRFGFYAFSEMTEWHNGVIGATGIITALLLSIIGYIADPSFIMLKMSVYYAFVNMFPISNLDGTQILFGSRVLYFTLMTITLIFTAYAFIA